MRHVTRLIAFRAVGFAASLPLLLAAVAASVAILASPFDGATGATVSALVAAAAGHVAVSYVRRVHLVVAVAGWMVLAWGLLTLGLGAFVDTVPVTIHHAACIPTVSCG